MVQRFLLCSVLLGGLVSAGTLGGCQGAAATPAAQPVYTNDNDRNFSQLLGTKPFDITLNDGEVLHGCTFYNVYKVNDKDFLHVKDFLGIDYMVRYEHIEFIRRP